MYRDKIGYIIWLLLFVQKVFLSHLLSLPNFPMFPGSKWTAFVLRRAKVLSVQLVSKISNLCGPDPPTLQTDGRTDDILELSC